MQRGRRKFWNGCVALVAAYLLFLQGLAGAFAVGQLDGAPPLDPFGHALCLAGGGLSADISATRLSPTGLSPDDPTANDPSDDPAHSFVPDCCRTACSLFASLPAPDRTDSMLLNPLRARTQSLPRAEPGDLSPSPKQEPHSPRGPPPTA